MLLLISNPMSSRNVNDLPVSPFASAIAKEKCATNKKAKPVASDGLIQHNFPSLPSHQNPKSAGTFETSNFVKALLKDVNK
jgi:hypothetical protein